MMRIQFSDLRELDIKFLRLRHSLAGFMEAISAHASMNDGWTQIGNKRHPHPKLIVKAEVHLLPKSPQLLRKPGAPKCALLRDRVGHEPVDLRGKCLWKLRPLAPVRLEKSRPTRDPLDAIFELFGRGVK